MESRGFVHDQKRAEIIAEIGSVHDGSLGNAMCLIEAAAECGADVVKFQTHIAVAETLRDAPTPPYFGNEPRWEYFDRTGFSERQWSTLKAHCEAVGVEFLSSPFSLEAVELLERVGAKRYKIPSGEVTNLPLLEQVGRTGKPILVSSGMSSWTELDAAIDTLLRCHDRITVLQCTSAYPCPYERVGLNVLREMKARYSLPVGLSDHTLTNYAVYAAIVLGAAVVEKHFTLSRRMYGSDAKHSAEPEQFGDLVRGVRAIEAMLTAPVDKNDVSVFKRMKEIFEKSIVTLVDVPAGATITSEMIGFKKPGTGLRAARRDEVIGRRAVRAIAAHQLLTEEDLE